MTQPSIPQIPEDLRLLMKREHRIPLGWKVCAWLLLCMGIVGRVDMEVEQLAAEEPAKEWREPLALSHPLNCDGTWHRSCADFEPCKVQCIREANDGSR